MQLLVPDHERQALGTALRTVRQQAGLRQTDLATRLGVPQSFVSKIESGFRRLDLLEVRRVCQAMDTTLDTLLHHLESALASSVTLQHTPDQRHEV